MVGNRFTKPVRLALVKLLNRAVMAQQWVISGLFDGFWTSPDRARFAAWDRLNDRIAENCEICSAVIYRCPICHERILLLHTHENDFTCEKHGMVDPIRESDGAVIDGDGRFHGRD